MITPHEQAALEAVATAFNVDLTQLAPSSDDLGAADRYAAQAGRLLALAGGQTATLALRASSAIERQTQLPNLGEDALATTVGRLQDIHDSMADGAHPGWTDADHATLALLGSIITRWG